ncbi:hypothetical protein QUW48_08705 [Bifidobacterium pullorum]|uniref:DUF6602 domain-containing protein n=1 Tax=Bifidobacterium pullorum TaxID=78448 RepID=UPI0025A3C55B|nr:DUF6602 domain-containing protein [Bifidobacterium pullorum]MDM8323610.1 hypothetical protein [Bifidobacterium pullorum]
MNGTGANDAFGNLIRRRIEEFERDFMLTPRLFCDENGTEGKAHPGEYGAYRERIVAQFIEPFLPGRLSVGTGFIVTPSRQISTQCDVVVYDREHSPHIEEMGQRFFPIESVVAVIEVKSKLNGPQLSKALRKLSQVKTYRERLQHVSYEYNGKPDPPDPQPHCLRRQFDPRNYWYDQIATFLICERVPETISSSPENLVKFFEDTYEGIPDRHWHNAILSIGSKKCFMYQNEQGRPFFLPRCGDEQLNIAAYGPIPESGTIKGYDREHIAAFLRYFALMVSQISVLYVELSSYLGVHPPKQCVCAARTRRPQ